MLISFESRVTIPGRISTNKSSVFLTIDGSNGLLRIPVIEAKLNENNLVDFGLKVKIKETRKTSNNKRYTLRTTDWLSESGKKRRGKKKIKTTYFY